jgi:hypothetical protein
MTTVPLPTTQEGGAAEPTGGLALLARLIATDLRRPTSDDQPESGHLPLAGADDDAKVIQLHPKRRRHARRITCTLVPATRAMRGG